MIDWTVDARICGLGELSEHAAGEITHRLSILDPEWPHPDEFAGYPARTTR